MLINMRGIVVKHKSYGLQRINDLHPSFMVMQYPLLFLYGEDGFHLGIKYHNCSSCAQIERVNVTAMEFCAYIIQQHLE